MKMGSRTTYILLARGYEDVALLMELKELIARVEISGIKIFAKKFPLLLELKQGLESEVKGG